MITIQDNFSGGMTEDKRLKSSVHYFLASNFDTTYANKLVPQFAFEADEEKTYNIVRFLYSDVTGTAYLIGLGYSDASNKYPKLFYYDINSGYTGGWTAVGSGVGGFARKLPADLFYYKSYVYMWDAQGLSRYGSAAFDNDHLAITSSQQAPSVLHPNTDIAYFFHDNIVASKSGTDAVVDNVLTFATNKYISSACVYGNYLAIALTDEYYGGKGITASCKSEVVLWDMSSTLADINERIDFGEGRIVHLANLDGQLTAVVAHYADQNVGLGRGKILIKQANGYTYRILNHLNVDVNTSNTTANDYYNNVLKSNAIVDGNKMYFSAKAVENSDNRHGIWSVDSLGRLNLEIVVEGATSYEGIYKTGNMWWVAHSGDGSIERTDDTSAYSTTQASVYESLINLGDSGLAGGRSKKLVRVGVMTEPLPAAGQIVLKYKVDAETSWTTIFTEATDNSVSHYAINIESTGGALPQFKEIQFQVSSTGGAVITGIFMESELLDKDI